MPQPRREQLMLPKLRMQASFEPKTMDTGKRTIEMRWYSGAEVQRFSFFDGPYTLRFSLEPKAVRLERLNAGAPLKGGHGFNSDLSSVFGVIEKAWIDKDGGHAVARFSEREDVEPFFRDVEAGIIRNVSMETQIHELEDVTEKGAEQKAFLATDWEPLAVALVAVGADPGATLLSEQAETFPCQLMTTGCEKPLEVPVKIDVRLLSDNSLAQIDEADFDVALHSKDLEIPEKPAATKPTAGNPVTAAREVDDAIERDQLLAAQTSRAAEHFGLDDLWAQRHINLGTPIKTVLKLAAEERSKRAPKTKNDIGFGTDYDSVPWKTEQMAVALSARSTNQPIPEPARPFAGFGFVDLAYEQLKLNRRDFGVDPRNRSHVIELSLSTSDFPGLLANAGNKILLPAYNTAMPSFKMLCIQQDVADFKSVSILNTGDFPSPLAVGEGGEIKLGYFAEQKNTVLLGTYGRRLSFTRQMLINDDLNSFGRVMGAYGIRVADVQNAAFYTLLGTVGPTLGDTGAMFNATALTTAGGHANYTSSGTAISDTAITVGYALMAAQTGIGADNLGDGVKLNVAPKFLLAAPGKRNLAFQYTSSNYVPSAPTSMNSWAGVLTPILDANLTGNRWWLFADPALFPNFAYGSLAGSAGPRVATRPGFEVEGVELRVAYDWYVGGIDFRGSYCNAGA